MTPKLLKAINYVSITITLVLTIVFFVNLFGNPLYRNDSRFSAITPSLITQPVFVFLALIISIKADQQKGNILFSLFLSWLSANWVLQTLQMMNHDWIPDLLLVIHSMIAGVVYIKLFQCFPRQITRQDIKSVFPKRKILSGYLAFAIKNYTWFIFPVILAGLTLLVGYNLMDVLALITGLLGLYVNFKKSSSAERDKILWLFWGILTFTFLVIIRMLLTYFTGQSSTVIKIFFSTLTNFVLVCSLVMSLFFSNAFDTGILIRRTLVDGFLFIIIVLIYNTVEHYFLHWLSHELGISDVLLSSLLSGIFVLAFSPLHHRFMGYLEKRVKKHAHRHSENTSNIDSTYDIQGSTNA